MGPVEFHSPEFRQVIEDHLDLIRVSGIERVETPSGRQYSKYKGDFTGLLIELGVREHLHWITLRVNELHSSGDYLDPNMQIKIIRPSTITGILDRHLSASGRL
jgi:hypothetical protein